MWLNLRSKSSKKDTNSLSRASSTFRKDTQGNDLALFLGYLSRSEKISEIKPSLEGKLNLQVYILDFLQVIFDLCSSPMLILLIIVILQKIFYDRTGA